MGQTLGYLPLAIGLFVLLLLALEVGFRAGRSLAGKADPSAVGQIGAVQGALLGLLGLLLAFSFAAAGSRFLERQDLIVTEANAIGTAYLRADLLDEPHKSELRSALERYTRHRIEVSHQLAAGLPPGTLAEVERLHGRIWEAAVRGVLARPEFAISVLSPVNEVIDLHSTRVAAGVKQLPTVVVWLLIASSLLSVGVIGYGSGVGGHRRAPLTVSLVLLVAAALWITIDLDHPRGGMLQLNDAPLKALKFGPATDQRPQAP